MTRLQIDEAAAGTRIDAYLAEQFTDVSRASWQRRIADGDVQYNGQSVKPKQQLHSGDTVDIDDAPDMDFAEIELPILYENDKFLVVDKPPGLLTHPIRAQAEEQSVVGLLQDKLPQGNSSENGRRPGVVHRLDRDTSGVLLLAKTVPVQRQLSRLFAEREVKKTYRAVLVGEVEHKEAVIRLPLGRDMSAPATFKVDPNGKAAETKLERLAVADNRSYVKLSPTTGRTHQLRVHCAHIGHPIVGDALYGRLDHRLMLHAYHLAFSFEDEAYTFEAPLPNGFSV
jgi:23S rRNA pseudouridine1911/1915/1917 synthase